LRKIDSCYKKSFSFQWHITTKCRYNCSHCYIEEIGCNPNRVVSIPLDQVNQILAKIVFFFNQLEKRIGSEIKKNIILTGGDPLLHPDFLEIAERINEKGFRIGILGCPETFKPAIISKLKDLPINSIQFSIDGIPEYHDQFRRSKGSFSRTIKKIMELKEIFRIHVMYTVCKENMRYLIPTIELLNHSDVPYIDFARVAHRGGAGNIERIEPQEYRQLLNDIYHLEKRLGEGAISIGKKDPLWKLLYYEKGEFAEKEIVDIQKNKKIVSGCPCGFTSLTLLHDGRLDICRRFDSTIGFLPDDDILEKYIEHTMIRKIRNPLKIEGCAICKLKYQCRGCPAIAYNLYGEMGCRDPQCWKIVIQNKHI
jgi:radical SAM protein with 4Fe4S-binding SPASM domain